MYFKPFPQGTQSVTHNSMLIEGNMSTKLSSTVSPGNPGSDVILSLPKNIVLRQYRNTDVPSISRHANNKRIWNNLRNRMPHPYTEEAAQKWIDICRAPENQRASGEWTPEDGAQGPLLPGNYTIVIGDEACGSIGLDWNDPTDICFRNAEIGYWLSEEHWGKGYMSIIVPAFVDWAWRTFGFLIRINAEVSAGNVGSRKCLEKAGLVVEGRRKMAFVKNGALHDEVLLGMVRPGAEY